MEPDPEDDEFFIPGKLYEVRRGIIFGSVGQRVYPGDTVMFLGYDFYNEARDPGKRSWYNPGRKSGHLLLPGGCVGIFQPGCELNIRHGYYFNAVNEK
jgi:hypothetical protein